MKYLITESLSVPGGSAGGLSAAESPLVSAIINLYQKILDKSMFLKVFFK